MWVMVTQRLSMWLYCPLWTHHKLQINLSQIFDNDQLELWIYHKILMSIVSFWLWWDFWRWCRRAWLGFSLFDFLLSFLFGFCWLWVCWVFDGGAMVVVLWWMGLGLFSFLIDVFLCGFCWVFMVVLWFWCIWWWWWYNSKCWRREGREGEINI